jgi:Holliday junction resolvase RusA-like endonuclease
MNGPEQDSAVKEPRDSTRASPNITQVRICLPIPRSSLWPNGRPHWSARARAAKAYRQLAWAESLVAMRRMDRMARPPRWTQARCQATFFFADYRRRDRDNCLAALKAAFDGLADAGVIANDVGMIHLPVQIEVDTGRPRVELRVTPNT